MSNRRTSVYERDGWQCQMPVCLCPDGRAIDPGLRGTGSLWAPSIDHVVRRSMDGPNSEDNVRAAHRRCNMADAEIPPARPRREKPLREPHLSYRIGDLYAEQAQFFGDQGSRWS
jgi:5-methylcytosine-specific restriction endonuclease McrA